MDTIKLFCDVAQWRSVSRAALAHGVTQSAASQRIQALERELGVQLIDRSTRPLQLTAAGDLYHHGCRRILASYEKLTARVIESKGSEPLELRGEVVIAAIYSAGIELLNQIRADFEAKHPKVHVAITYFQPETVYDRVIHEQCDLGILSYPERWRGLTAIPLRDEQMVVVVRAGHDWATRPVIHPTDLADGEMVSFDRALPIAKNLRRYLRSHGVRATLAGEFDNIDTIKTYVAETEASAILPFRTVQREIKAGSLIAIPLAPALVRPIAIVYPRHHEQEPLVKAFIDYLAEHQPSRPLPAAASV
ncbi:MAG: LysR family transcriptional regulator [Phycisphaeraceae bacterium]